MPTGKSDGGGGDGYEIGDQKRNAAEDKESSSESYTHQYWDRIPKSPRRHSFSPTQLSIHFLLLLSLTYLSSSDLQVPDPEISLLVEPR